MLNQRTTLLVAGFGLLKGIATVGGSGFPAACQCTDAAGEVRLMA